MIRLIEYLLNGLVYALHGYAWAIKNNPLTDAWRNIEKSDWGKIKLPPSLSDQFQKDVKNFQKAQQQMNNPDIGNRGSGADLLVRLAKAQCDHRSRLKPTGFKEHVRREARILERLKPIRIFYSPYVAYNFSYRDLGGTIVAAEPPAVKNSWSNLVGGIMSGFL